jgi:glutaredoxin
MIYLQKQTNRQTHNLKSYPLSFHISIIAHYQGWFSVLSWKKVKNLYSDRFSGEEWVKNQIILYVKSEKIPVVQYSDGVPGHPCTGWGANRPVYCYKQQDQEAINLLEKAGIAYERVDLSKRDVETRLKARITGLNETPTLIFHGRKIKGLENIKQVLQKVEA